MGFFYNYFLLRINNHNCDNLKEWTELIRNLDSVGIRIRLLGYHQSIIVKYNEWSFMIAAAQAEVNNPRKNSIRYDTLIIREKFIGLSIRQADFIFFYPQHCRT